MVRPQTEDSVFWMEVSLFARGRALHFQGRAIENGRVNCLERSATWNLARAFSTFVFTMPTSLRSIIGRATSLRD